MITSNEYLLAITSASVLGAALTHAVQMKLLLKKNLAGIVPVTPLLTLRILLVSLIVATITGFIFGVLTVIDFGTQAQLMRIDKMIFAAFLVGCAGENALLILKKYG